MDRQLRKTVELKSLVNVFDETKKDEVYKRHKKEMKKMKRKIDNHCPTIASSKFFPQMKLKAAQGQMEIRARANMGLVSYLNKISRTKGKVDCYNPIAAFRNSNLESRIVEQKLIESFNRKFYEILKSIEPSEDLTMKDLVKDWHKRLLPDIIDKATYPIVVQSLLTPEYDLELDNPPSHKTYAKSLKIRMTFNLLNHGPIGKVVLMLNQDCDRSLISHFVKICRPTHQACVVSKILRDVLIEVGDKNLGELSTFSETHPHDARQYPGTLSLLIEEDNSVRRFCLTLKRFPLTDRRSIVIGRVIKGFDTLLAINTNGGTRFGRPSKTIYIQNCFLFK